MLFRKRKKPKKSDPFWIQDGELYHYAGGAADTIVIPPEVKKITCVFFEANPKRIYLPEGLEELGSPFAGCSELVEVTTERMKGCGGAVLPEGLRLISDKAFAECAQLSSAVLPSTLETAEYGLFANCHSLTSLTIPDRLRPEKEILYGCESLEELVIRRRDGRQFRFSVRWKEADAFLKLLLKTDYYISIPPEVRSKIICQMITTEFIPEHEMLPYAKQVVCAVIDANDIRAMEMLDAGIILRVVPKEEYEKLIVYANERGRYEIELMLLNAMQKYNKQPPDMMKRLQL